MTNLTVWIFGKRASIRKWMEEFHVNVYEILPLNHRREVHPSKTITPMETIFVVIVTWPMLSMKHNKRRFVVSFLLNAYLREGKWTSEKSQILQQFPSNYTFELVRIAWLGKKASVGVVADDLHEYKFYNNENLRSLLFTVNVAKVAWL